MNKNQTEREKQQKSNIDKLDLIMAALPEAQYSHDEPKKQEVKKEDLDRVHVDENGDVKVDEGYVIGLADDIFGDKIYDTVGEQVTQAIDKVAIDNQPKDKALEALPAEIAGVPLYALCLQRLWGLAVEGNGQAAQELASAPDTLDAPAAPPAKQSAPAQAEAAPAENSKSRRRRRRRSLHRRWWSLPV